MSDGIEINGVLVTDIDKAVDIAMQSRIIDDEYRTWKKNAVFLYDIVITQNIGQPSLTCQWLPEKTYNENLESFTQKLIIGGESSKKDTNCIKICEVRLPTSGKKVTHINKTTAKLQPIVDYQEILHEGDVHSVRYMPQNPNILATQNSTNDVFIFDRTKHSLRPLESDTPSPQLKLTGHSKQGHAIAWNPTVQNELFSGAEDGLVLGWNVESKDVVDDCLAHLYRFEGHTDGVNGVSVSYYSPHSIASVSDDKHLFLWDSRTSQTTARVEAHSDNVNCVSYSPHDEHVLLTGSSDKTLKMWDVRNLKESLHTFNGHTEGVYSVEWSPFQADKFASGGHDRRVHLWDLSRIGEEQDEEDAEDGDPELLFTHAGHIEYVNDLSWNPNEEWIIASVGDDSTCQVWQITSEIYQDDVEDEDEDDLDLE